MQKTPVNTVSQRMAQQTRNVPPLSQSRPQEAAVQGGISPALQLAERIRNEQGRERVQQFLLAMEPFLAPAERSHIAEKLGVQLPVRQSTEMNAGGDPFSKGPQPFRQNAFPPQQGGNPLEMMQLLSGLGAMGGKGNAGTDQLALAQLLGSMMGNRKK